MQIVKQSAVALFLAVFTFAAGAHPHSFISLKTELVTDGTQLSGLKMRWTMDEITPPTCCTMPETQSPAMRSGKSWRRR